MLSQEKQEGNRGCTERLYQSQHEQEGLERAVAGRLRRGRQQGEERRRLQRKEGESEVMSPLPAEALMCVCWGRDRGRIFPIRSEPQVLASFLYVVV